MSAPDSEVKRGRARFTCGCRGVGLVPPEADGGPLSALQAAQPLSEPSAGNRGEQMMHGVCVCESGHTHTQVCEQPNKLLEATDNHLPDSEGLKLTTFSAHMPCQVSFLT